jgi:NADPH:quinone reductase-like Zn-dependent oxidoreductase
MPDPEVGDHDVLVEVRAAGVNPLDSKIAAGEFRLFLPYRFPLILGNDLAGVVVRVGSAATRFEVGDEVYGRPDASRIGTFAQFIAVHEADLAPVPGSLTMEDAASFPLVGLTAWQALEERAGLTAGQKVLIHAGSGGVGTIAIQLAKHLGATVATTTSAANVELVQSLGADVVVDYTRDDFETVLSDYDVVLDPLGAKNVEKSLSVLKPGGVVIGIGGPPDPALADEVDGNAVLRLATRLLSLRVRRKARRLGVRYSFLFMRAAGDQLRELTPLLDSGAIRPVVDRVFPFGSTTEALAHVDRGRAVGKVVVAMTEAENPTPSPHDRRSQS